MSFLTKAAQALSVGRIRAAGISSAMPNLSGELGKGQLGARRPKLPFPFPHTSDVNLHNFIAQL